MRIYIPSKPNPSTGKGFFCGRLLEALQKLGHSVTDNSKVSHNVSLHLVKLNKGKGKRIVRLDGCYHNTAMNYGVRNKEIAKHIHKADGIIYQSQFSKKLCDKYLGKFNGPVCVIPNGCDPLFYSNVQPIELPYENCFLTASRWRPHKRLEDIIESFLLANIPDSCLYIAGDLQRSKFPKSSRKKYFALDNVKYLDKINQKALGKYLKSCKGFIHLCWFDNCPNAVVEAICSRTPVISNNVGGTPEIVEKSDGIVCDIDLPYDLRPVKLYSPPRVNHSKIAQAMNEVVNRNMEINCEHVNIANVAQKYWDFSLKVFGK